jgi:hypothetical protein
LFAHLEHPSKFLYFWGCSAISELNPAFLSGDRCLFYFVRHFRTANSMPLISISRNFSAIRWIRCIADLSRAYYPINLVRSCGSRWKMAILRW